MATQAPFDMKPFNPIEARIIAGCRFTNAPISYAPWLYKVYYDIGNSDDPWSDEAICFKDKATGVCPYMPLVEGTPTYDGNCSRNAEMTSPCTEDPDRWFVCDSDAGACTHAPGGEYDGDCPFDTGINVCPDSHFDHTPEE